MIIIIDFDNTIVKGMYPDIGYVFPLAAEVIAGWKKDGHSILIDTCRAGRYEGLAVESLIKNKIPFNYVNCNLPSSIIKYGMDCRKLSGDLRIDDTQLGGLPLDDNGDVDWVLIDMRVRSHKLYKTVKYVAN